MAKRLDRAVELIILVILLLLPVVVVAAAPRSWPLVAPVGLGIVVGWAIWAYSKRDEVSEFYGGLIPILGGAFLLLWLLASFVGYRIGRRRSAV